MVRSHLEPWLAERSGGRRPRDRDAQGGLPARVGGRGAHRAGLRGVRPRVASPSSPARATSGCAPRPRGRRPSAAERLDSHDRPPARAGRRRGLLRARGGHPGERRRASCCARPERRSPPPNRAPAAFWLGADHAGAGEQRLLPGRRGDLHQRLKTRLLGVPPALLREHGAVSEPVARTMAEGARRALGSDYGDRHHRRRRSRRRQRGQAGGDRPHRRLAGPAGAARAPQGPLPGRPRAGALAVGPLALEMLRRMLLGIHPSAR